jgi:O-antigen/teichoic acid export membrane protein
MTVLLAPITKRFSSLRENKLMMQAAQMAFLRFGGLGLGALAQIYAARQLGPEKLGISGMALTAVAQGSILITFGADALLVRQYRAGEEDERQKLVQTAYTMRLLLTVMLAVAMLSAIPFLLAHPQFWLASLCVIPLVFFQSNQALWILQAKEAVPAQYLANTASAVLGALLIFLFIRQDSPAGSDMVAGLAATILAFGISWYSGIRAIPRLRFHFGEIAKLLKGSGWLFLSAVVTYGYTRFEQPLVGTLRSVHELGIYRSALQITNGVQPLLAMVPLLLYPKLISWREVSMAHLWEQQKRVFFQFLPWICLLSVMAAVALPIAYPIIFGPLFKEAAIPCALLVSSKLVVILNGIFGWGLWAAKRDATMFGIMSVVAAISIFMNFALIPRFGIFAAAGINLFSEVLILVICAWFMHRLTIPSNE